MALVLLDTLRRLLIAAVVVLVAVLLWRIAWYWAVIWVIPGLVVTMNIVGFLTVPLYWWLGARAAKPFLQDFYRSLERSSPPDEEG